MGVIFKIRVHEPHEPLTEMLLPFNTLSHKCKAKIVFDIKSRISVPLPVGNVHFVGHHAGLNTELFTCYHTQKKLYIFSDINIIIIKTKSKIIFYICVGICTVHAEMRC